MKYYEYDAQGFLVGWHEDGTRPNSSPVEPAGIAANRARWDGSAWASDASREMAEETKRTADAADQLNVKAILDAFDPATATAADVRIALKALIRFARKRLGD